MRPASSNCSRWPRRRSTIATAASDLGDVVIDEERGDVAAGETVGYALPAELGPKVVFLASEAGLDGFAARFPEGPPLTKQQTAALDLFDAFGSTEKTLHANMGGHTGVPH